MLPLLARGATKLVQGSQNTSNATKVTKRAAANDSGARGIENVKALTSNDRFRQTAEGRLMQVELQNVAQKKEAVRSDAPNDNMYENDGADASSLRNIQRQLRQSGRRGNRLKRPQAPIGKNLGSSTKWFLISIASISYIFQMLFGLLSLAATYGANVISSNFFTSLIDKVVDVSGGLQSAGSGLWGMSALIVVLTFICFWAWYWFIGIDPFHSMMSMFLTLGALAFCLVPGMNLFPWLVLWVIYINGASLFNRV